MRLIAQFIGAVWMIAFGLLWIGTGFLNFDIVGDMSPIFASWSVMGLIASGGFGLSFLCLLLVGLGYGIWAWGSAKPSN